MEKKEIISLILIFVISFIGYYYIKFCINYSKKYEEQIMTPKKALKFLKEKANDGIYHECGTKESYRENLKLLNKSIEILTPQTCKNGNR